MGADCTAVDVVISTATSRDRGLSAYAGRPIGPRVVAVLISSTSNRAAPVWGRQFPENSMQNHAVFSHRGTTRMVGRANGSRAINAVSNGGGGHA